MCAEGMVVEKLARQIEKAGKLIHPITIDKDGTLVAGERRLAACKRLGWKKIPAMLQR